MKPQKNKSVDKRGKIDNAASVFALGPVHDAKAKGWDLINLSVQVGVSEPWSRHCLLTGISRHLWFE